MRTKEELDVLFAKFDRDVRVYPRWYRLLIATDQWFAVLFWNTSMDETISSHIGRKIQNNTATWFDKKLCCFLKKLEHNHCNESLGE